MSNIDNGIQFLGIFEKQKKTILGKWLNPKSGSLQKRRTKGLREVIGNRNQR
jgi:hypothetical protein